MNSIDDKDLPWTGSHKIIDTKVRASDLNGKDLNLFKGTYKMATYKNDIMIRKGHEIKLDSYKALTNFQHDNAIPLLDFYSEAGNQGRLIIPKVDGSFKAWVETQGKLLLFDKKGLMSTFFRNMIIDMCDLLENLHKINIIPLNLKKKNLYVKLLPDGKAKLLVLLTEVEEVKYVDVKAKENWKYVRKVIDWCRKECNIELDSLSKSFSDFIGESTFSVRKLRTYPDTWDYKMKGDFLLELIAAKQSVIRSHMSKIEISWPYTKDSLPELLDQILEYQSKNDRIFDCKDSFDYIRILRHSYKHFCDLPENIKLLFVNEEGLINTIESWTPEIWIKLYERIGWP